MFEKLIALLFITAILTGCSSPTYQDGSERDYSDMPWNTPQTWEGGMNIPGMNGYE